MNTHYFNMAKAEISSARVLYREYKETSESNEDFYVVACLLREGIMNALKHYIIKQGEINDFSEIDEAYKMLSYVQIVKAEAIKSLYFVPSIIVCNIYKISFWKFENVIEDVKTLPDPDLIYKVLIGACEMLERLEDVK